MCCVTMSAFINNSQPTCNIELDVSILNCPQCRWSQSHVPQTATELTTQPREETMQEHNSGFGVGGRAVAATQSDCEVGHAAGELEGV